MGLGVSPIFSFKKEHTAMFLSTWKTVALKIISINLKPFKTSG